jgi:hypothetical protein
LIGGKNLESSSLVDAQGSEVSLIERQQLGYSVSFGKNDDRGISQADLEIGISIEDFFGPRDVLGAKRFESICSTSDFRQKRHLSGLTDVPHE